MVREYVINSATMNIDLRIQQPSGHSTALNMPAGPAAAPRTVPADVTIFFIPRFPECEIANALFLVLIASNSAGGSEFFQIQMRKVAVIGKPIDAKINETILSLVRLVAFEKFSDHLDHLGNIGRFGRSGIGVSGFDTQG
jgi:hypothetical protein